MKIALIVGHEKKAQGASNANGETEYSINGRLAPLIAQALLKHGHEPVIVYRDGTTYSKLPKRVNQTQADIALSLHCNAFNTKATGSEVLHYVNSTNSERLASLVQTEVVQALGLRDRGLRPVDAKHKGRKGDKGGHLCKYTAMPCVIVEYCFIDNDNDLATAIKHFEQLALAIATGAMAYAET
ncbi:N-acetylmuramoyl-L-alanine amidase [Vibrio brasiliensis]|uniref:N-acetylmuramoyl-L-alanine amidase n=1 Tax=Vibrio brasiliensis TaxID=170652 RepID=UPI001EFD27F2|nr:N-acetylmuramoyl-L-alanine amidase [Vibrio brasiliensis]MCG9785380.1 N-acetylmuramoyl-L-alanine amidase [Vibrio brasiliensis]